MRCRGVCLWQTSGNSPASLFWDIARCAPPEPVMISIARAHCAGMQLTAKGRPDLQVGTDVLHRPRSARARRSCVGQLRQSSARSRQSKPVRADGDKDGQ
eukprot:scaffold195885_cov27-Tisochrysis_lutea.AAC.4